MPRAGIAVRGVEAFIDLVVCYVLLYLVAATGGPRLREVDFISAMLHSHWVKVFALRTTWFWKQPGERRSASWPRIFVWSGRTTAAQLPGVQLSFATCCAAAGYGKYLTDGKTFEALVGYDIANDTRHTVVYRLPRA